MTDMRHARRVLGVLREAAALEARLRRVAQAAKATRQRNPREMELVEISPGVWAVPRRRAPESTLGRWHDTAERIVDAFDESNRPRGRRR